MIDIADTIPDVTSIAIVR